MFFVLSKLLSLFLQPFIWVLGLLIALLIVKKESWKRKMLTSCVVIVIFFSNTVIFSEFTRLWEIEGQTIESVKNYDIAVVLGGMSEYNTDFDRLSLRRGGDRIWQALQLYKAGKVKKILISGANGHLIDKGLNEAAQLKTALVNLGIPEIDVLTEAKSRNTYENAVETKKVIDAYKQEPSLLLVTSALHMKRAKACFKKAGFKNFGVFTTDHYTGSTRGYQFDQYVVPDLGTLANWNLLIKEWVGYIVYSIVGYI